MDFYSELILKEWETLFGVGFFSPWNVLEAPLIVTKHVNYKRPLKPVLQHLGIVFFICSLVVSLHHNRSRQNRLPWSASNQGQLCPVLLRAPLLLLPLPARNGLRAMAIKKEQSFPRRAAPVIPTSATGAVASPPSFLSPLSDTILSPFHISRATFNFAYTFQIL